MTTDDKEIKTFQEEISKAFSRHNYILKIFDDLIEAMETKNKGDMRWFFYCAKIGKKFRTQALTLKNMFSQDIYFEKDGTKTRFIDISSLFSLLRVQLETYAVFFHLFADKCSMEEKIVRFRLWQLDGLKQRQNYNKPDDEAVLNQISNEVEEINGIINHIKEVNYFKSLPPKTQEWLIENSQWKFSDSSLKNPDKKKWKISLNKMVENIGLKETHFGNWYSYTSTHTHTNYWSVVQNDTLTPEQKITTEYIAIMQATFLICFFTIDLARVENSASIFYNSLQENDRNIIKSFDVRGRTNV